MAFLNRPPGSGGPPRQQEQRYHTPSFCPKCGHDLSKPVPKEDAAVMLDALEEAQGLTGWEEEFVSSLADQYEKKGSLSPRQMEILRKIYDEKGR